MEVPLQMLGRLSSSFPPAPSISPHAGRHDLLPLSSQGPQPPILCEEMGEGLGAPSQCLLAVTCLGECQGPTSTKLPSAEAALAALP